jgi:hypothetical protein
MWQDHSSPGQEEHRVADHKSRRPALLIYHAAVVESSPLAQQLLRGGVVPEAPTEVVCCLPARRRAAVGDLCMTAEWLPYTSSTPALLESRVKVGMDSAKVTQAGVQLVVDVKRLSGRIFLPHTCGSSLLLLLLLSTIEPAAKHSGQVCSSREVLQLVQVPPISPTSG